ncbi:UNVERIFIED_CONTAM: hypothetical protein Scaly_2951000 [Sesamum calycinum]|uniref:Reverse transcriptase/retrotransposon-derived protein RNase H-like domain-containing protein n=1 Tax=Sesamum calycinum TaxID=2727403 RepID=A0AAW2KSZ5_9LAMI
MCIDFWDLNKACPKNFYPLPRIDQLVDSTSGGELLSMMDASQGYDQIMLAPEDHKRVGRIMEIYVDDMLVKSKEARNHVEDLEETFVVLRKYRLKLNPGKCVFGVKDFEWTKTSQRAFEELKAYLAKLPLLAKPTPGDILYLYLSSTSQAVSSVLAREEDGAQTPIYHISKVLNGVRINTPHKQVLGKPETFG